MKRFIIFGWALAMLIPPSQLFAGSYTNFDVVVKDTDTGAGVPGAMVYAVTFTTSDIDGSSSRVAMTDANGVARFSTASYAINGSTPNALVDGGHYDIAVASQGFGVVAVPNNPPGCYFYNTPLYVKDQFPPQPGCMGHIIFSATIKPYPTQTIAVSSVNANAAGEIIVAFKNATPYNVIFGNVQLSGGSSLDQVGFGTVQADAAGTGTMTITNVPYGGSYQYNIDLYDSGARKHVGKVVDQTVQDPSIAGPVQYVANSALDFTSYTPPPAVINNGAPSGSNGNISVDGVVTDTISVQDTISWIGIQLQGEYIDKYNNHQRDFRWVNADQNGHFSIYGLIAGVTYYTQIQGGCNWQNGYCYSGYTSPVSSQTQNGSSCLPNCPAPGPNDILYNGIPIYGQRFQLNVAPQGSGKIAVYVQDQQGRPLPQAFVNIGPDYTGWLIGGTSCPPAIGCANEMTPGCMQNNPGLVQENKQATTGYALLTGLQPGNYQIQAWTPFSQGSNFGSSPLNGTDGTPCWSENTNSGPGPNRCSCSGGNDDLRLTVYQSSFAVFNASGANITSNLPWVGASSIAVTVQISTVGLTGAVTFNVSFPPNLAPVDLSNDPINITLWPQCNGGPNTRCPSGGFLAISSTGTAANSTYAVQVSSAYSYWMNVRANYWGVSNSGGGQNVVDLTISSTAVVNLQFNPGGRVKGNVYKPDGSLWAPPSGSNFSFLNINAEGHNTGGFGWAQVNNDGSYAIGGLPAGAYELRVSAGSGFAYTDQQPRPTASVVAGKDTIQDVNMANGVVVQIQVDTTTLPSMTIINCGQNFQHDCPPENWHVHRTLQNSPLDATTIAGMLLHNGSDEDFRFTPSTSSNSCEGGPSSAGFCTKTVNGPAIYDMYLIRHGGFDSGNLAGVRPYVVFLNATKNVLVDPKLSTTTFFNPYNGFSGSSSTVQAINLTPATNLSGRGQATIQGAVTGANIIRQQDFNNFGGSFDNLLKYIPILTLKDVNGNVVAAGAGVPNPSCFASTTTICGVRNPPYIIDDCFNQAVTQSSWTLFSTLLSLPACGGNGTTPAMGFQVRGVSTGTYTATLTTPNYPLYKQTVTLTAGTTTTLNINLDQAVGSGATIAGVVQSTAGVALAGANVSIAADNYLHEPVQTSSAGYFSFAGLPAGAFRISASFGGYASYSQFQTISAAQTAAGASVSVTIQLQNAPGSISGLVVVQPPTGSTVPAAGARIVVYNPTGGLSVYRAVSSSTGYEVDGLLTGTTYYVTAKLPRYFRVSQPVFVTGAMTGINFQFDRTNRKPMTIDVRAVQNNPNNTMDFVVKNPDQYSDGNGWISTGPFVSKTASLNVKTSCGKKTICGLKNCDLIVQCSLGNFTAGQLYTLHVEAQSIILGGVTKDLPFALNQSVGAYDVEDAILGDDGAGDDGNPLNTITLNGTGLTFQPGAVILSSTGTSPSGSITQQTAASSNLPNPSGVVGAEFAGQGFVRPASTAAYASNIFSIVLSSINYTQAGGSQTGVDISLAYDVAQSTGDLGIYHFNVGTNKWEAVPGVYTVGDGVITVHNVPSLASITAFRPGHPMVASVVNGMYVRPAAVCSTCTVDSGNFAVLHPSLLISTTTATPPASLKIFNFPNPFNLSLKTVTAVAGGLGPQTIYGTMIKIELPVGVSGSGMLRIYTIAGELVRELDLGNLTGGSFVYTQWDGLNKSGSPVANGVYYGVVSIPGVKAKDGTFKMAVIK